MLACDGSLEQDLGHHPLVLVIQQMTMKYRNALDDGVGEVQNDINGAAIRNIHRIQPHRMRGRDAVFCIDQEVDLVNVERDRKSTRLNSSHLVISYAVFCLKKKKKSTTTYNCLLNLSNPLPNLA